MSTDGSEENAIWPMPKFHFEVDLGDELKKVAFQEVSGMDVENQIIEYRHSNSKLFSTIKMPGIVKYGNITMKPLRSPQGRFPGSRPDAAARPARRSPSVLPASRANCAPEAAPAPQAAGIAGPRPFPAARERQSAGGVAQTAGIPCGRKA